MRYLRLLIGSVVVLAVLYVIVAEQMTGASANAFVNAPVVTVRSPVAGDVRMQQRELGSSVLEGQALFSVVDQRVDSVRLNDLILERDLARAELTRLEQQLDARQTIVSRLDEQTEAYHAWRTDELEIQAGSGIADPAIDLANPDKEAVVTPSDASGEAGDTPSGAEADVGQFSNPEEGPAASRLLPLELEAAKSDIFLDNSAGPVWNHDLRLIEAQERSAVTEADMVAARARLEAFETRIGSERRRLVPFTGSDITSPVNGIIWQRLVADGVNVQRGDPVVRVVDCDATIVTLSVTEIVYNSLSTGDAASFLLSGEDTAMPGTVARLAGPGAATVYQELAVAPSQEHLERYDVTLIVPALREPGMTGCALGRTGRAFFEDRPLDFFRRVWN